MFSVHAVTRYFGHYNRYNIQHFSSPLAGQSDALLSMTLLTVVCFDSSDNIITVTLIDLF